MDMYRRAKNKRNMKRFEAKLVQGFLNFLENPTEKTLANKELIRNRVDEFLFKNYFCNGYQLATIKQYRSMIGKHFEIPRLRKYP